MMEGGQELNEVDRFIQDRIDSVPHLEALLLLWRERPKCWSAETLGKRLWVKADTSRTILQELKRDGLIGLAAEPGDYCYQSGPEMDHLLQAVHDAYRREMVRISNMIHAKPSSAVREFARAFRLKKEQN
jgi:hypothetical protein